MIEGVVNGDQEAVVTLAVHGPSGGTREIEAVVDTGFSGFLTVTPGLVMELGLDYRTRGRAILADGSAVSFDVYDVTVLWDGHLRHIRGDVADTAPLVGMSLLDGHRLCVDVEDGGRVVIEASR